jgi:hypothetical protein
VDKGGEGWMGGEWENSTKTDEMQERFRWLSEAGYAGRDGWRMGGL